MIIHRSIKYRLYPTVEQVQRLEQWQHALRFLWNIALEQRLWGLSRSKDERKYYTAFEQIKELTDLRSELDWLSEVPRHATAECLINLDKAWQRCFKKLCESPSFKKKSGTPPSICEPDKKQFRIESGRHCGTVLFPKLGAIKAVIHQPLQGKQRTCSIIKDCDQWFAVIVQEIEIPEPLPSTKPAVALDRGVAKLIADSNGRSVPGLQPFKKLQQRIARAQRMAAKKKKGSKNKKKAYAKVAKLYQKARRIREHVLHCESKFYANSHGTIFVEKLQIKNMTKSAKGTIENPGKNVRAKAGLNRVILDSGWGRLVGMLKYKVVPNGGTVVELPAAYSSQTCSKCGCVHEENRETQASFLCVDCGHQENADINAAKVLLARGLNVLSVKSTEKVCGGDGVTRPKKQKLRAAKRVNL